MLHALAAFLSTSDSAPTRVDVLRVNGEEWEVLAVEMRRDETMPTLATFVIDCQKTT
jgi:hypothetical protein